MFFTGVGAAHLPGEQGVIEMIRSKGYTVRPVPTLQRDREGQRNIQDIIAPVSFTAQYNEDSLFSFFRPGYIAFLKIFNGNRDRIHYADMSNGAYFLITRVRTLSLTEGFSIQDKIRILDSIIYENIPGRITARTDIRDQDIPRSGHQQYIEIRQEGAIPYLCHSL
ncbi:MAG: TraB/GumN family protein [Taibaiella sp.]|nr:TraB/GumN family protein [Taibaiella sp.]